MICNPYSLVREAGLLASPMSLCGLDANQKGTAVKHYAIVSTVTGETIMFPLHKACADMHVELDHGRNGYAARPIRLVKNRMPEECASCQRSVCRGGKDAPSTDHAGNEWDFA